MQFRSAGFTGNPSFETLLSDSQNVLLTVGMANDPDDVIVVPQALLDDGWASLVQSPTTYDTATGDVEVEATGDPQPAF